ncbi:hypothetical protein GGX14DRAFT_394896 [Mycena pura]|uniref:Uncharacterized protein n=1 Tax=Mycena pura TaxID=153505 RepID=A0AAD6VHK6_9AGAR|nr:hypothetical protein GGX14DRAFT_394896 [Mycena pura]
MTEHLKENILNNQYYIILFFPSSPPPSRNEWTPCRPQDPGWAGKALDTSGAHPTDYLSELVPTIITFNAAEIVVPPSQMCSATNGDPGQAYSRGSATIWRLDPKLLSVNTEESW